MKKTIKAPSPSTNTRLVPLLIEVASAPATSAVVKGDVGSAALALPTAPNVVSKAKDDLFCSEEDQQDFYAWMAILRPSGPFVGAHSFFQPERRARQELVFRNCPALNAKIFEQISAVYQDRWVFLESEAQSIFGEYYQPFLAVQYLNRLTLPAHVAIQISGSALQPSGDVAIVYPSATLMSALMWASTRLTFVVGFGLATISPVRKVVGASAIPVRYPPLWLRVQQLLLDPNSALHAALNAPAPPASDLNALASIFELPGEPALSDKLLHRWDQPIGREDWSKYSESLSTVHASGALAIPYDRRGQQLALVCSPNLLSALFEHVVSRSAAPASKRQVYSAQHVSLALSEAERREVIASFFGTMRRSEITVTNSGTCSAAPLKKIASAHWPTMNPALTRQLLDKIMGPLFRGFDRPRRSDDPGWCAPSVFLDASRWPLQLLPFLPEDLRLLQVASVASDGTWTDLNDLSKSLAARLKAAYIFRAQEIERDLSFACFLGWWCGFIDLAFDLDAKGVKSKVCALRVNRAAMQRILCPEVPSTSPSFNDPSRALIVRPSYTSTVDVLPTGEILTPPDLDPLIRLCVATIFTYKGANTYTIPRFKSTQHLPIRLTAAEVEELLNVVSRHEVPASVKEQIRQLPCKPPPTGLYAPDFILTNIDKDGAEGVLAMTRGTRFFAAELSPSVWGFYRIDSHKSAMGLRQYEPTSAHGSPSALRELLNKLERRGLSWNTDLKPLNKLGNFPVDPLAGLPEGSVSDRPTLPEYKVVREFFEVRPDDPDWIADTVGVHIFTLIPPALRENTAFRTAMRACTEMTTKAWPLSYLWEADF